MKNFLITIMCIISSVIVADEHPDCQFWAESGECDKNPSYMLESCADSCRRIAVQALRDAKELNSIESFFDLSAKDIHGDVIEFSKFKGQVTILVNVASYCGYTDSHYKGMVRLWKKVAPSKSINLLAFPCNQFGEQEPKSNAEIEQFAKSQYGVEFTMMDKIDVNGPNTNMVYKYLKLKGDVGNIGWNFATYFIVGPDGDITAHSGVEPLDLEDFAMGLLSGEEL